MLTLIDLPLGRDRRVNAVLIEGEALTLVDTGINEPESLTALEEALSRRGRRVEDLQQIVITHAHPDHFGAAHQLASRSKATVIADPVSTAALRSYPHGSREFSESRGTYIHEAGAPATFFDQLHARSFRTWAPPVPIPIEHTVDDGDQLVMGDATWQVVQTPGHAISEICFFDQAGRTLLSGDIVLGRGGASVTLYPYPTGRPGRWVLDILTSLDHLAAFQPERILPGHGPEIFNGCQAILDRRAGILRRLDQVRRLVQEKPTTAWEATLAVYNQPTGTWATLFQTIGYLEALEAEGKIHSTVENGRRIYM